LGKQILHSVRQFAVRSPQAGDLVDRADRNVLSHVISQKIAQKWRDLTLNLDFALDFPSFCSQGQLLSATDSGITAHRLSLSVLARFIAVGSSSRSCV